MGTFADPASAESDQTVIETFLSHAATGAEARLAWPGLAWPLAWPGWPGLAWLAWPGLAWPGLAWPPPPGLAWPDPWPGQPASEQQRRLAQRRRGGSVTLATAAARRPRRRVLGRRGKRRAGRPSRRHVGAARGACGDHLVKPISRRPSASTSALADVGAAPQVRG